MINKKDLISINIISYVTPFHHVEGFEIGKPFVFHIKNNVTLKELINMVFSKGEDKIGVTAVNKKIVPDETTLKENDNVYIFEHISGG